MRSATVLFALVFAAGASAQTDRLIAIKPGGMFIKQSTLAGETRKDDVVPRHAVCLQLAKTRWLIVYTTHGYRGVDDERSVLYQIRTNAPDGDVIKEGFLGKAVSDWRPDGVPAPPAGKSYFKQLGHAVAFGVPKEARIDGRPAVNANAFVAQWRVLGRRLVVKEDRLEKTYADMVLFEKTQDVEYVQFRLNDREDDIEITQSVRKLRPKGARDLAVHMNQSFCPPVPFNREATEWVVCNHFDKGKLAVLKMRYDPDSKRYDWVETGPFLDAGKRPLTEASIAKSDNGWLISARTNGAVAWFRTDGLFAGNLTPTIPKSPVVSAPQTAFRCADGVVRLFTGDKEASPQKYDRDPLYVWNVKTSDGVALEKRRTVFDSDEQKLAMRRVVRPRIDFAILFPPFGREQILIYSVTPRGYNHPYEGTTIPPATLADKAASGLYYSRLVYDGDVPAMWRFE